MKRKGISLFSSGGIGDLAMRACGVDMLVANELLEDRAEVFMNNFKTTKMIVGDIYKKKEEIINSALDMLQGRKLDVIFATPPCQGMSKNGRGKLLSEMRAGRRDNFDLRNELILPTIDVIKILQPEFVFFENVPEMEQTEIYYKNKPKNILSVIKDELAIYTGLWKIVEFADYGVPERRQRLITVFTKNAKLVDFMKKYETFLPPATHSQHGTSGTKLWVTLRQAIGTLPHLDAKNSKLAQDPTIPFHRVPVLDENKYYWVKNTPEGKSAFDNQCACCNFKGNTCHGTNKKNGINQSNKDTPIYCKNCGSLLPRPWVVENGQYRIMKGYTSAYKRMLWDIPASALTRNMSYACSDNKLHPTQNRVLSLHEAFIIHTIDQYKYIWMRKGNRISDKTIREIIGESIPPKGLEQIIRYVFQIAEGKITKPNNRISAPQHLSLFGNV